MGPATSDRPQYTCQNQYRRQAVDGHGTLNGIDYLEVLDRDAPEGSPRQRTLLVRCLKALPADLKAENVQIRDVAGIKSVQVQWVARAADAEDLDDQGLISEHEKDFLLDQEDPEQLLVVRTRSTGDYSTYRLKLVRSPTDPGPPQDFDPILAEVTFSFKVECPSEFDCQLETVCPPEEAEPAPPIDYLTKDYASFRQLMLDRLSVMMPQWEERNAADLGIALVELLAYAADHLSYYQDAAATEAYLGTARKRTSIRRHARLLDYVMHEGCNARAWVQVQVDADNVVLEQGAHLLTRVSGQGARIKPDSTALDQAMAQQPLVFQTMHRIVLREAHNEIDFYTWGDEACCLPKGATRATLCDDSENRLMLRPGDILVFQEVRGPDTGRAVEADPAHRHAVRLTHVSPRAELVEEDGSVHLEIPEDGGIPQSRTDPLTGQLIVDIEWAAEDALPFPLCLWHVKDPDDPEASKKPISVVRGNIVLADHGRAVGANEQPLLRVPESDPSAVGASRHWPPRRYRPRLARTGITHAVPYDHSRARTRSAAEALETDPRAALPAVTLLDLDDQETWTAQRDLLNSSRISQEFVVEMEDGVGILRFGDDVLGREPASGTQFQPSYRVGNGREGNIGSAALAHVVTSDDGIQAVCNPLPARGGADAEPIEQVRLYAPQAFRTQERAVTEADYAAVAETHSEVQKAVATRRWTGSWHTMFVTVDRQAGRPVDAAFEAELRAFLERFRLAGHDLEIEPPQFVPLNIVVKVCVAQGYYRADVKAALLEVFSNRDLGDGRRGFFHPDRFTFGQPVYLSQIVSTAMEVPGVEWVDVVAFHRWGRSPLGEREAGVISTGRLEIAVLDNDPNAPENGKIEFIMEGGL
jgi:hypothetical protein